MSTLVIVLRIVSALALVGPMLVVVTRYRGGPQARAARSGESLP